MSTETRAAFARRIGINKSNVTRAAQAGRIVLTVDGLVDVEASLERWHATKGNRPDVAARHAAQRGAEVPNPIQGGENATAGQIGATAAQLGGMMDDTSGRAQAKRLALQYENSQIKLEMALRRGLRFELQVALREATGLGAMLRAAIERAIDQTAPTLAVSANPADRRRLLAREIRRMRSTFKRELSRSMRRLQESGAGVKSSALRQSTQNEAA